MAQEDEERCPVTAQATWRTYQEVRNRWVVNLSGGQVRFPANPNDHTNAGRMTEGLDEAAAQLVVVLILDQQDRKASSRAPFPRDLDRLLTSVQQKSDLDTVRQIADQCWLLWR